MRRTWLTDEPAGGQNESYSFRQPPNVRVRACIAENCIAAFFRNLPSPR